MTSDAKIGLLLGLVFIFVIAFLINGLPGLHNKDDTNKLTTNMVGLQNSPPGIGANERKVQMTLERPAAPVADYEPQTQPDTGSTGTRFVMALPEQNTTDLTNTAAKAVQTVADAAAALPAADNTPAPTVQPQPAITEPPKPTAPQSYVVQEGDSLSSIAKKFYGDEEGNKLANVNAIFEANRITLVSADDLYVGQKLVIPPLASSTATPSSPGNVLTEKVFSKVESIGKRHLPVGLIKSSPPKKGNTYIVKEGDSLWRIASDQLGDGNRYKEIVKLNKDILTSEDDIQVDMKLKLPAR